MQDVVAKLLGTVEEITGDLEQSVMDQVVALLDRLTSPVSRDDAIALVSLLPKDGDLGQGVNWTVLHAIETAPDWPVWSALNDPENEWMEILEIRLNNGGLTRP